ncbi:SMP-30/gluconolactonase/LRE family protein [Mangrovibacterium lignilyticum]|uniref:SMP-30/gluconolactonase/LRE family protein n=1 Tax=Mangrovibacterium lignilyticum TaxID=2668052 RepID=UPI0013D419DA|nr:SMP-30/gluconolactonase/LRE family protein [Mangrovibacterium lignilyticum]
MTINLCQTNKRKTAVLIASFILGLFATVSIQAQTRVVAAQAKLVKLAGNFKFTEGPAVDKAGNIYFTDQPNDRIMKWSTKDQLSTFMQPCGRANGLYFDKQGNLLACADEKNELWSIDPTGIKTVLVDNYANKLLNGPNDLWVNPLDSSTYFTDPLYERDYWNRGPMEQDGQHVYLLSSNRKNLKPVFTDLKQPNGIVGTPDGKTLYVADIGSGQTFAFNIQPDGSLTDKRLFCTMGSDGMTIDNEGNVYLTGNGVTVFNKEGMQIDTIPVPEAWTANVCIGGKDKHTLFITASTGLYAIRLRTGAAE